MDRGQGIQQQRKDVTCLSWQALLDFSRAEPVILYHGFQGHDDVYCRHTSPSTSIFFSHLLLCPQLLWVAYFFYSMYCVPSQLQASAGRPFSLVPFLYQANSYSSPTCLPGLFQEAFLDLPRLSRWPPCVLPEQPVLGGLYNDRHITALCKQWPLLLLFLDGTYHSELETVHALPGPRPLLCLYHLPYCRAYNKRLINICWNNKNLSYTTG